MSRSEFPMTRRAVVLSGVAAAASATLPRKTYAVQSSPAQVRMQMTKWPAGAVPSEWITAKRSSRGHLSLKLLASERGVIAIEEVRCETTHVAGFAQLEI